MKWYHVMLLGLFASSLLSSCSPRLSPFTQRLYDNFRWSDEDLQRIQFYVSEDIVLRRELRDGSTDIYAGKVRVVNGRKVEEVIIRRGTPGILMFKPSEKRFAVSFEDGGQERYLMFGPNPKFSERYVLLASDWKKDGGSVTYDGRSYEVAGSSAYASLMVNMKKIDKLTTQTRTAQGRRIN